MRLPLVAVKAGNGCKVCLPILEQHSEFAPAKSWFRPDYWLPSPRHRGCAIILTPEEEIRKRDIKNWHFDVATPFR